MDNLETSGFGQPLPIKLSRIVRFEDQPRRFFDEKALDELADNIVLFGQKTPVRVCKHAREAGVFVLIGGERRWRAFHKIQERTGKEPVVKAFVDIVKNHEEHFKEALLDNLMREDLCAVDEAASYAKLKSQGMSTADIAKMVQKSVAHIDSYLKIDTLPDNVKSLLDAALPKAERLQTTIAIEIARSTNDPDLSYELAMESVERDLGVLEARALITSRVPSANFENRPGRKRRASDNYAVFQNFIATIARNSKLHLGNLNISSLYDARDEEDDDRYRDSQILDTAIENLQKMREQVSESKIKRFERRGW